MKIRCSVKAGWNDVKKKKHKNGDTREILRYSSYPAQVWKTLQNVQKYEQKQHTVTEIKASSSDFMQQLAIVRGKYIMIQECSNALVMKVS